MPDPSVVSNQEILASAEFLRDPASFGNFSEIEPSGLVAVECIDPRDQAVDRPLWVSLQTPGGGAGVHIDRSIYAATKHADPLPNATESLGAEAKRTKLFFGAHYLCALVDSRKSVTGEMVQPTDFTHDTIDRFGRIYDPAGDITKGDRRAYDYGLNAVNQQIGALGEHIHEEISGLSDQQNVVDMKTHKAPYFYVVSHDPQQGLDRQKMHRNEGLLAQTYFDGLGALIQRTLRDVDAGSLGGREYGVRLLAAIAKTAATRTVINQAANVELANLEIDAKNGLMNVAEIAVPSRI